MKLVLVSLSFPNFKSWTIIYTYIYIYIYVRVPFVVVSKGGTRKPHLLFMYIYIWFGRVPQKRLTHSCWGGKPPFGNNLLFRLLYVYLGEFLIFQGAF